VYHFLQVKNRAVGVERKVRSESNKRVDIVVPGKRDFYIEIKNINEPELAALKETFAEEICLPLSKIKSPYFVHFRFFKSELQRLSLQDFQPLISRIEDATEKRVPGAWIFYPSQEDGLLSFLLEKATLPHCTLGRYGYGKDWPYCFYSEEYLEKEIENEEKILEQPSLEKKERVLHLQSLKRYRLLKDNSPFFTELELKLSILRGIKDSEMKFPAPSENGLNILLLHFGGVKPVALADIVTVDLARWYYSLEEGRGKDRWWDFYDIWAREEGFQKEGIIDAIVSLLGRGIEEPYRWKIVYARRGLTELESVLLS
jgi:hypothetical protein